MRARALRASVCSLLACVAALSGVLSHSLIVETRAHATDRQAHSEFRLVLAGAVESLEPVKSKHNSKAEASEKEQQSAPATSQRLYRLVPDLCENSAPDAMPAIVPQRIALSISEAAAEVPPIAAAAEEPRSARPPPSSSRAPPRS